MQQAKSGIKFSLYAARKKFLFYANVCMTLTATFTNHGTTATTPSPKIYILTILEGRTLVAISDIAIFMALSKS